MRVVGVLSCRKEGRSIDQEEKFMAEREEKGGEVIIKRLFLGLVVFAFIFVHSFSKRVPCWRWKCRR